MTAIINDRDLERARPVQENAVVGNAIVLFPTFIAVEDRDTHWFGGPDFCVEIARPGERVEDKLPFYASVGTREVLLILRSPKRLRLARFNGTEVESVEESTADNPAWLESRVVPLAFRLGGESKARTIEVRRTNEPGEWAIPLS